MKKALVLGVLAFFAINIATVQNVNAQDKKAATVKTEKNVKPGQVKKADKAQTIEKKEAATQQSVAKENKAAIDVKKEKPSSNAEVDPTVKHPNEKPLIGVPPTPNKPKAKTSVSTTKPNATNTK